MTRDELAALVAEYERRHGPIEATPIVPRSDAEIVHMARDGWTPPDEVAAAREAKRLRGVRRVELRGRNGAAYVRGRPAR